MKVVKPFPSDIQELLESFLETNNLPIKPIFSGGRSTVYRIQQYALKIYSQKGRADGEAECTALLALQGTHVPDLYAYNPGVFVLMEWIDGLNLTDYRSSHGQLPPDLIYDMLRTELDQLRAGFKDWDFKLTESLVWTVSGDVKRLDLGICDPVGTMKPRFENDLLQKIEDLYNNEPNTVQELLQDFMMNGIMKADFDSALANFQAKIPRLS
ncbi:phosphotransferase [Paenibacillus sp. Y412MC10]|uniref:phosphotransferase n=1 Tax=Geobacillus sp. (strain Y412MC10) TaxID=481743 RepID=UPI0011AB37D0|nr:phosphotransferase [Paenibacillus sp. Y412MC10]